MGIAGGLNDRSAIPGSIKAFYPNAFGVYNMSGNVSEWVMDVYRPLTPSDGEDFNYFRGNRFQKFFKGSGGELERDSLGRLKKTDIKDSEVKNRRNYQHNNALGYMDGDSLSTSTYSTGASTLISDHSRVFKGGSWSIGFRCAQTYLGSSEGPGFKEGNIFGKRKQNSKKKI
jgi:formylglycine-generating enzyme required for sulfatase activity